MLLFVYDTLGIVPVTFTRSTKADQSYKGRDLSNGTLHCKFEHLAHFDFQKTGQGGRKFQVKSRVINMWRFKNFLNWSKNPTQLTLPHFDMCATRNGYLKIFGSFFHGGQCLPPTFLHPPAQWQQPSVGVGRQAHGKSLELPSPTPKF